MTPVPPPGAHWIPGHEGTYAITPTGRVWSAPRERTPGGWLLTGTSKRGYAVVNLGRRRRMAGVHVLLLETFVGPRPPGQEARHLDGNPLNNDLSNLSWGTLSEQRRDDVRNGLYRRRKRGPRGWVKGDS